MTVKQPAKIGDQGYFLWKKGNDQIISSNRSESFCEFHIILSNYTFSDRFYHSQIVFEVVNEKYTSGIWKKIVEMKMKRALGFDAGSSYNFGVRQARDIESYGNGFKIIGEWSYLEDEDIRPKVLKYLRHFKTFSKTQWTIIATINENR